MFELVVCDLDGTLVDSKKEVSEYTKEVVKKLKDKNIHFTIATGRALRGAKKVAEALGLKCDIICNNGSTIYDEKDNLIFQRVLDIDIVKDIFKIVENTESVFLAVFGDDTFIAKGRIEDTKKFLFFPPTNIIEIDMENIENYSYEKIVIMDKNQKTLFELDEKFKVYSDRAKSFLSQGDFLDVVHHESSKGIALKFLAEKLGVPLEKTIAFGDAFNDYEMLKFAGKGVVMPEAFEELKEQFEVNPYSHNDSGVARYLEKLFDL